MSHFARVPSAQVFARPQATGAAAHSLTCRLPLCAQVVSTVIGSTISLLCGWLILPWFASSRMLADQAAALQASATLLRRMHAEVAAAAAARRAVEPAGWLEALEEEVQVSRKAATCLRGWPASLLTSRRDCTLFRRPCRPRWPWWQPIWSSVRWTGGRCH